MKNKGVLLILLFISCTCEKFDPNACGPCYNGQRCIEGTCLCDPRESIDFCDYYCISKKDSFLIHPKDSCMNVVVISGINLSSDGYISLGFSDCYGSRFSSSRTDTSLTNQNSFSIGQLNYKLVNDSVFVGWARCKYYPDSIPCEVIWRYEEDLNIHRDTCYVLFQPAYKW